MIKSIIAFLLSILSLQLFSQIATIQFSEEQLYDKEIDPVFFGSDSTGVYSQFTKKKNKGSDHSYQYVSNNLSVTPATEWLNIYKSTNRKVLDFVSTRDKIYVFTRQTVKNPLHLILYLQTFNKGTLELNKDTKTLIDIDCKKEGHGYSTYEVKQSPDSSKIMVNYIRYTSSEYRDVCFHVYDSNMNLLWEKIITLPFKSDFYTIKDYMIDNKGNTYVYGKYEIPEDSRKDDDPYYNYKLVGVYNNGQESKGYSIDLDGKFIEDIKLCTDNNNNMHIAGFYTDNKQKSVKGIYYLKADGNLKELSIKQLSSIETGYLINTDRENKEDYFKSDELICNESGCMLLTEQQYTERVGERGVGYSYNDVVLFQFNKDGTLNFKTKIPMRQYSSGVGIKHLKYTRVMVDNYLYLLYMSKRNNLEEDEPSKVVPYESRDVLVMVEKIDLSNKGKRESEELFSRKENDILIVPKVFQRINSNEIIILCANKFRGYKFAKVSFK